MSTMTAELVDTKPIEQKLLTLKERAEAIVVKDAESYAVACQVVLDGRQEIKAIGFVLDPGINSAKAHLDKLRNDKAAFVGRVTPIVALVEQRAETWKAEERRKAQAEQDRINEQRRIEAARIAAEERRVAEAQADADRKKRAKEIEEARKAGDIKKREADKLLQQAVEDADRQKQLAAQQERESAANVQTVTVAPAVPKVAGIRGRVNWKFRIAAPSLIPRNFLMPDEVSIGQMVRDTKNKMAAEKNCPGIEVFSEDSI